MKGRVQLCHGSLPIEDSVNNSRIQLIIDKHSTDISNLLRDMVMKNSLLETGYGRGRTYRLNKNFIKDIEVEKEFIFNLTEDEAKITGYMKTHGFINNQISRAEFNFSKYKNVDIFNSLLRQGLIKKVGSGRGIKYILKQSAND